MRMITRLRLSWWQRTRFSAFALAGAAVLMMFLLTIVMSGLSQTAALGRLQFLATTLFPLLIVVLIATKVRLQRQNNLKSSGSAAATYSHQVEH